MFLRLNKHKNKESNLLEATSNLWLSFSVNNNQRASDVGVRFLFCTAPLYLWRKVLPSWKSWVAKAEVPSSLQYFLVNRIFAVAFRELFSSETAPTQLQQPVRKILDRNNGKYMIFDLKFPKITVIVKSRDSHTEKKIACKKNALNK